MNIGKSVADGECWFRVITNADHITRDNTINLQAFKGTAFKASNGKPWQHELSGRLASLAGDAADIVRDAHARADAVRNLLQSRGNGVPSKIRFVGLAVATTDSLRMNSASVTTDVVFAPLPNDSAHTDFVTFNTFSEQELAEIRNYLVRLMKLIQPVSIVDPVNLCGSPAR